MIGMLLLVDVIILTVWSILDPMIRLEERLPLEVCVNGAERPHSRGQIMPIPCFDLSKGDFELCDITTMQSLYQHLDPSEILAK